MSTVTLPSNLPSVAGARLPETYQAAKNALAECSRIDECQQWANKAEALASYAKQAKDDQLRKLADRIQARAIRRCGELLKTFDARPENAQKQSNGNGTLISRAAAASDAGLSKRQQVTAVRVANVPTPRFEEAVESEHPPTITKLAELGKKSKPKPLVNLEGRDPKDFSISTDGQAQLRHLAEFALRVDASAVARGAMANERTSIRKNVGIIDSWLDQLIAHLED